VRVVSSEYAPWRDLVKNKYSWGASEAQRSTSVRIQVCSRSLLYRQKIDTFDYRAIENGANTLAEGFLFSVAAMLILGEAWRSSRSQSKRRDSVDDQLEELSNKVQELTTRVDTFGQQYEDMWLEEKLR
jgi:Optic atrophy 3 protein (OPA3)